MTGRHQYLPVCKMRYDQEVFDALKYRVEVDASGTRWYHNAAELLHRDEGPAIEYADGSKCWFQNGLLHRIVGPAVEYSNGDKEWWQNDQLHRTDGPAIEWVDGHKEWYQNGTLHRTYGPAIEYADGSKRWYINGKQLSEAEFNQRVKMFETAVLKTTTTSRR